MKTLNDAILGPTETAGKNISQALSQATGKRPQDCICPEGNLAHMLINAAKNKERGMIFVQDKGEDIKLSYCEILDASLMRLSSLRAEGIREGDHTILVFTNSIDFVVSFWACILGGIVPVPLAYPTTLSENNQVVQKINGVIAQLDDPVVLTDDALSTKLSSSKHEELICTNNVISLSALRNDGKKAQMSLAEPDDIAFIQYSSGSTGQPKGVLLTHRNLIINIEAIASGAHVERDDVYMSWMPLHHDMGLIGFHLCPVGIGIDQINMTPQKFIYRPALWLEKVHKYRANYLGSPNFGYKHILSKITPDKLKEWDLSCVKLIFNGAEPISASTMQDFIEVLAPCKFSPKAMFPCYGMAEGSLAVCFPPYNNAPMVHYVDRFLLASKNKAVPVAKDSENAIPIVDEGGPVIGCEVRVVNANDEVVEEGTVGHIQIAGDSVTQGYYNNDKATSELFVDGWLRTGDLGYMYNGRLCVTGRSKDIIFINGQNYFAYDIENQCERIEGVQPGKIAACGWHDQEEGREKIALFIGVRLPAKSPLTEKDVLVKVWRHLNETMGFPVDYIVPIKALPKTTSGKIQRYKVLEQFKNGEFEKYYTEEELSLSAAPTIVTAGDPIGRIELEVLNAWATVLNRDVNNIPLDQSFMSIGGSSIRAVQVLSLIEDKFKYEFGHDLLIKCKTVTEMVRYIEHGMNVSKPDELARENPSSDVKDSKHSAVHDIAIIGMGCKFPASDSPEEYWDLLKRGEVAIGEVPANRWEVDQYYQPDQTATKSSSFKSYSKQGGFVRDVYGFDAEFFGFTEAEAAAMDPQQRLFLQIAWETLERGGYSGTKSNGKKIGLFVGASHNTYMEKLLQSLNLEDLKAFNSIKKLPENLRLEIIQEWQERFGDCEFQQNSAVNNLLNMIAARTSHTLNLKGPSLTVDTACSSSLVATHMAIESIRRGECEMALAGGISLTLSPVPYILFSRAEALSKSGCCRVFDDEADGFVLGEGGGAILLKSLEAAIKDRDNILGVIKASSLNNDGKSLGVMAPNPDGQREVIASTYINSGIETSSIQYVEAHGTGTEIGDPSEVRALAQAYSSSDLQSCVIGSCKANIGHLLSAAGIASVIKVVMAMNKRVMPPSANLKTPNRLINFADTPFYTLNKASEWTTKEGLPRRAAINGFGFGGTNCHLIIEEAPNMEKPKGNGYLERNLLCLSSKNVSTLKHKVEDIRGYINDNGMSTSADISYTMHCGREHYAYRTAVELNEDKQSKSLSLGNTNVIHQAKGSPKITMMFTGQGSQYPGMVSELYKKIPSFKSTIDLCAGYFDEYLDESLLNCLLDKSFDPQSLSKTNLSQPAIFTVDYALGKLLIDWGVRPSHMLGHSVGEYAAACLAEIFSLEEAAKLIAARGKLMQEVSAEGGMLAVFMPKDDLENKLSSVAPEMWIAAYNGAHQVVAGGLESLQLLKESLVKDNIRVVNLRVSKAFHTPLMMPMLDKYKEVLETVDFCVPKIPLISNKDGRIIDNEKLEVNYWLQHILSPVCFDQSIKTLVRTGTTAVVECGPDSILTNLAKQIPGTENLSLIHTLKKAGNNNYGPLDTLAKLYCLGFDPDWEKVEMEKGGKTIALPTYPFVKKQFRLGACTRVRQAISDTFDSSKNQELSRTDDLLYEWMWKKTDYNDPEIQKLTGAVVVFADGLGVGEEFAKLIAAKHTTVILVKPGNRFELRGENEYSLNPNSYSDLMEFFDCLASSGIELSAICYLWDCAKNKTLNSVANDCENTDVVAELSFSKVCRVLAKVYDSQQILIQYVTDSLQTVGSGELCQNPSQVVGATFSMSLAEELQNVKSQVIDIIFNESDPAAHAQRLFDELTHISEQQQWIAIRGDERFVRELRKVKANTIQREKLPVKSGDTYLVTGGLGGIGAKIVTALASKAKVNFVIIGRTDLPPRQQWESETFEGNVAEKLGVVKDLERMGSNVHYISVDVSDYMNLAAEIDTIRNKYQQIHGVIHAAGVVDKRNLQISQKSEDSIKNVLSSKINGTIALDHVTKNDPLKFFILISSISASMPKWSAGLSDYAAANAFLDSYSIYRKQRENSGLTLAINWSLWDDCGMGTSSDLKSLVRLNGLTPLVANEAIEVFFREISRKHGGVVHVMDVHNAGHETELSVSSPQRLQKNDDSVIEAERVEQNQVQFNDTRIGNTQNSNSINTDESHSRHREIVSTESILDLIKGILSQLTGQAPGGIDDLANFQELALDSLGAVKMTKDLGEVVGQTLYPTLLFEFQTPYALSQYIYKTYGEDLQAVRLKPEPLKERAEVADLDSNNQKHAIKQPPRGNGQHDVTRQMVNTHATNETVGKHSRITTEPLSDDIAIIGMSCRYPGANNIDEYWQVLHENKSQIKSIPRSRWDAEELFDPSRNRDYTTYSKWGGFIDNIYDFDPNFFGISPKEAMNMDPQQRVFLQVAWEALQQSGYGGELGDREIGVYVGCETNTYSEHFINHKNYEVLLKRLMELPWSSNMSEQERSRLAGTLREVLLPAKLNSDAVPGNGLNEISARVSHWLNLKGPSMVVNTACSSSLVALHLAIESIKRNESRMAIAGGVCLNTSTTPFLFLSQVQALSETGECRPFDKNANGMVLGEGAGALLLKPLRDAMEDGDYIHAVIKSTAINNDGHSSGITAPNPVGQADAILKAYRKADIDPNTIDYIECHGTATPLGDPVEIEGMSKAFRNYTDRKQFCGIGSVKSTTGHTLSASGVSSIIKVALAMQRGVIPATLGYTESNPNIDFDNSPFYVVDRNLPWKSDESPLRAAVNAFGFGGTNCHVVLEEAPKHSNGQDVKDRLVDTELLTIAGRTTEVIKGIAERLCEHIKSNPLLTHSEACATMNGAQRNMNERIAFVVSERDELVSKLESIAGGRIGSEFICGKSNPKKTTSLHLVIDGGSLYEDSTIEEVCRRFPLLQKHYQLELEEFPDNYRSIGEVKSAVFQYSVIRFFQKISMQQPEYIHASSTGVAIAAALLGYITLSQAKEFLVGKGKLPVFSKNSNVGGWSCPLQISNQVINPNTISEKSIQELIRSSGEFDFGSITQTKIRPNSVILRIGGDSDIHEEMKKHNCVFYDCIPSNESVSGFFSTLGGLYASGVKFSYRELETAGTKKVLLPTYPFENRSFNCTKADFFMDGNAFVKGNENARSENNDRGVNLPEGNGLRATEHGVSKILVRKYSNKVSDDCLKESVVELEKVVG